MDKTESYEDNVQSMISHRIRKSEDNKSEMKDCEESTGSQQEMKEASTATGDVAAYSNMDKTKSTEDQFQNMISHRKRKSEDENSEMKDCEESTGSQQEMKEASAATGLYPSLDKFSASTSEDVVRILIIGKTGTGKSSLGNMLLGLDNTQTGSFKVGAGIEPKTRTSQRLRSTAIRSMMIVDTPDMRNVKFNEEEKQKELWQWKEWLSPNPTAILLTVRRGSTYTSEEYAMYKEIKRLWGNDVEFCQRLIVAFTFDDNEEKALDTEMSASSNQLDHVLQDAGQMSIHLNSAADAENKQKQVDSFLQHLDQMSIQADTKKEEPMDASTIQDERRILIIGKTGNGKSSLGNTITGGKHFPIGRGMITTTKKPTAASANVQGKHLKVVDTPDVNSMGRKVEERKNQVDLWKSLLTPAPDAILLAVRCDIRYTAEEHDIYKELKQLWENDTEFCKRLIVAFTFGDRQDENLDEELPTVCKELKEVLKDAGNQYILFDNKADAETKGHQVKALLDKLESSPPCDTTDSNAEKGDPKGASDNTFPQSILIIGKTGNGKSSLGNIIANTNAFPVGRGMQTTTKTADDVVAQRQGRQIKVVDTPDISIIKGSEKQEQLSICKTKTAPVPGVILLAVKCDVRYTAEEYAIYQEIKKLWGNDQQFCQRLMVAFTFGDRQDDNLEEELKTVCKELKNVLEDAGNFYLQFSTKASSEEKEEAVKHLFAKMDSKNRVMRNNSQDASVPDKLPSPCMDTTIKTHGRMTRTETTTADAVLIQQKNDGTSTEAMLSWCHIL